MVASAFIISSAVLFYVEGRTTVFSIPVKYNAGAGLTAIIIFLFANKKEV